MDHFDWGGWRQSLPRQRAEQEALQGSGSAQVIPIILAFSDMYWL